MATVEIQLEDSGYQPQNLNLKQCTKVAFKNTGTKQHWPASDLHPTHLLYPEFDPQQPVEPGNQWEFVFEKKGSWKYHDHLDTSIRGVITIQ